MYLQFSFLCFLLYWKCLIVLTKTYSMLYYDIILENILKKKTFVILRMFFFPFSFLFSFCEERIVKSVVESGVVDSLCWDLLHYVHTVKLLHIEILSVLKCNIKIQNIYFSWNKKLKSFRTQERKKNVFSICFLFHRLRFVSFVLFCILEIEQFNLLEML